MNNQPRSLSLSLSFSFQLCSKQRRVKERKANMTVTMAQLKVCLHKRFGVFSRVLATSNVGSDLFYKSMKRTSQS